jgi:hypothetical protein
VGDCWGAQVQHRRDLRGRSSAARVTGAG